MQRAEIEEAPDDGKWRPLALPMFRLYMTKLRLRWLVLGQLIRDDFLKHRYLGQEWRRLLEAAKLTVGHSFLSLGFVIRS